MVSVFVAMIFHLGTVADDSDLSPEQQLRSDLLDIVLQERLDNVLASVHVIDESGEEIFSYNSGISVVPASGQKLLVGAAALDRLGPDYTFETGVFTDGEIRGRVLHGDLFLRGTGDATMLPEDYVALAEEIADLGIAIIQGDLVADDTFFDDTRLSLDLSWFNQRRTTGAQISALTLSPDDRYDAGSVRIHMDPGGNPGDDPIFDIYPDTDYITIVNNVVTGELYENGGVRSVDWGREHGNNNIFVSGEMALDAHQWRNQIAVWEPTQLVQHVFHDALEELGVKVKGDLTLGATPEGAQLLAVKESMPLAEMFVPYMKDSKNTISENLTKTLGAELRGEGSWDAGLAVVEEYLVEAGLDTSVIQLRDGSGMSHLNKIPTEQMTKLLHHVKTEEWFDVYYNSIPIAGVDGTLSSRMRGTAGDGNVVAKTGTITSKTSLSGYVTTQDNEEFTFSVILTNNTGSSIKNIEDQIAIRLAEFSRGQ